MSSLTIFATVGGWLTLVSIPLFTELAEKRGARDTIIASLVIFGISVYFIYHATSVLVYGIAMVVGCMAVVGFSMVGTGLLGANWFPTKKGSALGWASIGNNLANLITLSILTALIAWGGVGKALVVFGIATIVWGIINWFCFPVDPRKEVFVRE